MPLLAPGRARHTQGCCVVAAAASHILRCLTFGFDKGVQLTGGRLILGCFCLKFSRLRLGSFCLEFSACSVSGLMLCHAVFRFDWGTAIL